MYYIEIIIKHLILKETKYNKEMKGKINHALKIS